MNKKIQKIKDWWTKYKQDPFYLKHWEWENYTQNYRGENRLSQRLTGRFFAKRYPYSNSASEFTDSLYMEIMPSTVFTGTREKYPVELVPIQTIIKQRMIADGIGGRGYPTHLGDAVFDFVRRVAQTLFQDGVAFYEIVYKKNNAGEIESFGFEWLRSFYLFRFGKNYYQIIPWWEAKASHVRVQIIKISAEKIIKITFPKKLGGIRKIHRIMKRLYNLGKDIIPKFQMSTLEDNKNIGFDFELYNKNKYLEIAKLTRKIGWNQGVQSANYIIEYYSLIRFLRQKETEVIVRSEILSKLNEALNGTILNLGTKIVCSNLLTLEVIEAQKKALKAGDVAFMDIFNATNI
jgi:hypothetical protein